MAKGVENAVIAAIWDPDAVRMCAKAGVGKTVSLTVGGRMDKRYSLPLQVTGTVLLNSDGREHRPDQSQSRILYRMGPVAVLQVKGLKVVLSGRRTAIIDPAQLRGIGIEPLEHKLIVLKMGYLFDALQILAPRSILMLSPGCTDSDLTHRGFERIKRPIYPLDQDTVWTGKT